jgi:hypothetical protein
MTPYEKSIEDTGKEEKDKTDYTAPESLVEDAGKIQAKLNWLASTVTQEIFADINKKILEKEEQARVLAGTYHNHQNPLLIVKLLVETTTLRKVIDDYVRTNNSNAS